MYDTKKLVLLGHPATGKTALTMQLVEGRFIQKHDATIEDAYAKYMEVDRERTKLQICDTAGDERYAQIRADQFRAGHGFLLVFSLTDRSSFYSVRQYYQDIIKAHRCAKHAGESPRARGATATTHAPDHEEKHGQHLSAMLLAENQTRASNSIVSVENVTMQADLQVGIVLVGTKLDREYADPSERAVTTDEIYALAAELHVNYHEVDVHQPAMVATVFEDLVRACRLVNVQDCVCGAREAQSQHKPHKLCVCMDQCVQCKKKRSLHSTPEAPHKTGGEPSHHETHPFIDGTTETQPCCAIQ